MVFAQLSCVVFRSNVAMRIEDAWQRSRRTQPLSRALISRFLIRSAQANQAFQPSEIGELVQGLSGNDNTKSSPTATSNKLLYRSKTYSNWNHNVPQKMHAWPIPDRIAQSCPLSRFCMRIGFLHSKNTKIFCTLLVGDR